MSRFKISGIVRVCLDTTYFTKNWKHCSKIIFNCVNSVVDQFLIKVLLKKRDLWICEQCMRPIEQCIIIWKLTSQKKKKCQNAKHWGPKTQSKQVLNIVIMLKSSLPCQIFCQHLLLFFFFLCVRVYIYILKVNLVLLKSYYNIKVFRPTSISIIHQVPSR